MSMYRRRENAGGDESCPFLSPWDASRHLHHLRCHLTTDSSVDSFVDRLLTAAAARLPRDSSARAVVDTELLRLTAGDLESTLGSLNEIVSAWRTEVRGGFPLTIAAAASSHG
eukprot:5250567-Pyramimonas_sp.AAC.1